MKIKCSKCSIEKAVRPEIMEQRIKKFGSKEKLLKGYLCRDCRPKAVNDDKPQKTGSMAKAVKAALKANNIVALAPPQKRDDKPWKTGSIAKAVKAAIRPPWNVNK